MKTAVVTGAARGIGYACARILADSGYGVAAIYKSCDEGAERLKNEVESAGGFIKCCKCNISDADSVAQAAHNIIDIFGGADVVVNNAGVSSYGLITDVSSEEFDRVMNTNVKGTFNVTKAFLPNMINRKSGKIINISSMWGEVGASCEVVYSASKAAIIGFTKALAKEVAPSGICVNCIAPGVIDTDMMADFDEQSRRILEEETPLGRLGTPLDIAKAVRFLASSDSDFITGQILGVNGGYII